MESVQTPTTEATKQDTVKPLLLLDVDGVLAPFGGVPAEPYEIITPFPTHWPILFIPENVKRLAELQPFFELVWATAWEHDANIHIAARHGLPALPVIEFMGHGNFTGALFEGTINDYIQAAPSHTWKLGAIEKYVGNRPFAWVDDDIHEDAWQWADQRNFVEGIPTLFLQPHSRQGLNWDDVEELVGFSESCQARQNDEEGA